MSTKRSLLPIAMIFFMIVSLAALVRVGYASFPDGDSYERADAHPGMLIVDCGLPLTIPADADSWVDQNSPASNFAPDGVLKVQSKLGGNSRALVRFTLPPVPEGCILDSARLYLNAASAATGRTLGVLSLAGDWSEDMVNWNNQPATTGPAATAVSDFGLRHWDMTTQIQAMYDTGDNYGFLIRDVVEDGAGFEQQFDIYDAVFNAMNTRPWVNGLVSRGYFAPVALQNKSASIHGKPASDLLWYWFPRLLGNIK